MVAVASKAAPGAVSSRVRGVGWFAAAVFLLVVGLGTRQVLAGTGVGDRSAIVMGVLLSVGAWLAARLLVGPRGALWVLFASVALLNLAALAPRNPPPYDDLQAFYRTDQVLSARVSGSGDSLSLLVQPVFAGAQPRFGLAGTINGAAHQWNCSFARGIQWLALPLRGAVTEADVQLHLSGAPSRDGDYLIVYTSSQQGGFLLSLGAPDSNATRCTLA